CLLFSAIQPTKNAINTKDKINPPVAEKRIIGPDFSPAKIGTPATPTKIYVIIERLPNFLPSIKPAKIAKNVCKVTGTVALPIGTAKNGNQTVIFAPIAINPTNNAPNVKSIGRNLIIFHLLIYMIINNKLFIVNYNFNRLTFSEKKNLL